MLSLKKVLSYCFIGFYSLIATLLLILAMDLFTSLFIPEDKTVSNYWPEGHSIDTNSFSFRFNSKIEIYLQIANILKGSFIREEKNSIPVVLNLLSHQINQKVKYQMDGGNSNPIEFTESFDQFGFRKSTFSQGKKLKNHLILMGGSFVFGHGLSDHQSLASYLNENNRNYHTYNFGFKGAGPSFSFAAMKELPLQQIVSEPTGYTIYFWNDFHIYRIFGTSFNIESMRHQPFVEFRNNTLISNKSIERARPLYTSVLIFLGQFKLLKLLGIKNFIPYQGEAKKLVCEIFKAKKELLKEKIPNSKLIVTGYQKKIKETWLRSCLKKNNISVIDLDFNLNKDDLLPDYHPNSIANKRLSLILKKSLNLD